MSTLHDEMFVIIFSFVTDLSTLCTLRVVSRYIKHLAETTVTELNCDSHRLLPGVAQRLTALTTLTCAPSKVYPPLVTHLTLLPNDTNITACVDTTRCTNIFVGTFVKLYTNHGLNFTLIIRTEETKVEYKNRVIYLVDGSHSTQLLEILGRLPVVNAIGISAPSPYLNVITISDKVTFATYYISAVSNVDSLTNLLLNTRIKHLALSLTISLDEMHKVLFCLSRINPTTNLYRDDLLFDIPYPRSMSHVIEKSYPNCGPNAIPVDY